MEYNIVENESFDCVNLSFSVPKDKLKKTSIDDELIQEASQAYASGSLNRALEIYDQLILIDKENYFLFADRSAILLKLGRNGEAIKQAKLAIQLKSNWAKVSF